MKGQARFKVYQDRKKEFRWKLIAANGRTIADSGEGYKTLGGVNRAVKTVRAAIATASVQEVRPVVAPAPKTLQ